MKDSYIAHIFNLLHEEECVIIPDFGGFLAQYRSAYLDKGTIYPPGRKISFNRKLQTNDGLLANYIARKENCSYNDAIGSVGLMVKNFEEELKKGRPLILKNIGTLILDEHQNLQFHPMHSVTLSHASFGLESVILPPLLSTEKEFVKPKEVPVRKEPISNPVARKVYTHKTERIEKGPRIEKTEKTTARVILFPRETRKKKNYWMAAALIPFALYLGVVFYQSNVLFDGQISKCDLNPFKTLQKSPYTSRSSESADIDILQEQVEIDLSNKIKVDVVAAETIDHSDSETMPFESEVLEEDIETEVIPVEAPIKEEAIAEKNIEVEDLLGLPLQADPQVANRPYHVIAGCFGVYSNAEGMVIKLRNKGFSSFIIDKRKGLNRVCYGSLEAKENALMLLKKVKKEEDAGAWLLQK